MATYFRYDLWAKTAQGPALAGIQVYVTNQPSNTTSVPPSPLATVYSDPLGASAVTQPIITDGFGHADFYAPAGLYTVIIAIGGIIYQILPDQSLGGIGTGFPSGTALQLQTNGAVNPNQLLLNLVGTGDVSITTNVAGQTLIHGTGVAEAATGTGTLLVSSFSGVTTAPAGDILTADGSGNAQDSGILLPTGVYIALQGSTDVYGGLIQNAINALPATGGTVDARSAGVAAVPQGSVIPIAGTTILLGPYTYTVTSITCANSLQIFGAGAQNTVIQASPSASVALFFGPGSTGATITNCRFEGFSCWGPAGGSSTPASYNSLHGFFLDASGASSSAFGGVWGSVWRQISFGGFGGTDIYLKGGLGFHQYNSFYDISAYTNRGVVTAFTLTGTTGPASGGVTVYNGTITGGAGNAFAGVTFVVAGFVASGGANDGTFLATASTATTLTLKNSAGVSETHAGTATGTGSGQAVRIEGTNYQHSFYNVSMQGPNGNTSIDGTSGNNPLLLIGGGASTAEYAYGMQFYGCNINGRYNLIDIDGAQDILIQKTHSEQALTFLQLSSGLFGSPLNNAGIAIRDCSFNANVGVNSGNGYIVYTGTANIQGFRMENCLWNANGGVASGPDHWIGGSFSVGAPNVIMGPNWTFDNGALLQAGAGGQPATVVATLHTPTTEAASIGETAWFTPVVSGLYRFSGSITCTKAGSTTNTCLWSVYYTNQQAASVLATNSAPVGTGDLGFETTSTLTVYCIAGDSVSYSTTLSSTTGTPNYVLNLIAEYLG